MIRVTRVIRHGWPSAAVVAFFAGCFAAVTPAYIRRYHIPVTSAVGVYLCFLLTLCLVVAPVHGALGRWRPKPWVPLLLWSLPYLAYAAGTGDFRWMALARLVAVAAPLPLIYGLAPVRHLKRFGWQDLAVAVWLIAMVLSNQLKGIWTVPANLDFMGRLFLIGVAAWSWKWIRVVPELGYEFIFCRKTFQVAGINFGWFALIALPSGMALHFIGWNPKWHGLAAFCVDYLGIFLFIALLEEMFFRGFLQTLISENLGSANKGQVLASCLFGLFHILHAPFPNWRYVMLATVAGWFYGAAFRQGGNLMAPAMIHALVDTLWRTLLLK
jgi:membrane protease YdiL (CAAX protease family)